MTQVETATKVRVATKIFRRVVRKPQKRSGEEADQVAAFEAALESTERFFARLPELSLEGRSVLDYGCGIGATPVWLAQHGAARAVGVDIQSVAAANATLERNYPSLLDRVSYRQIEPDYEVDEERFDIVVSKDTFEHVHDPDAYVKAMRHFLKPGGVIAIGFGPLWKSPWGGHIDFMTRMPWAHLIFPEQVILAERKRFRPDQDPTRFEEIRGGLNRMTLARFLDTMERSDLERRYLATNQSERARSPARRALIGAMRLGSRLSPLREHCTMNIYSLWSAP